MRVVRKNKDIKSNAGKQRMIQAYSQLVQDLQNRQALAYGMGFQYQGQRDLYRALGYPTDKELDFAYFYRKWDRNGIANAIINRPVDKCWNSFLHVEDNMENEERGGTLKKAWEDLVKKTNLPTQLSKLDKLMGIGRYAVLLLGFSDVKERKQFQNPATGRNLKLLYVKPVGENAAHIDQWDENPSSERYGKPLFYSLTISAHGRSGNNMQIRVHYTRVLHVSHGGLDSDIFGVERLRPVINNVNDIEKIVGGDAEMFWRGARPGYTALAREGYEMDEELYEELQEDLSAFENDLRRFITANGVDVQALAQQVADPLNHLDVQIQIISAQTEIPKRILVGSERGELASAQDKDAWLRYVKTRTEDFVEPVLVKPLVERLMKAGVLPEREEYQVIWEDLFAPSEKERAEIGEVRSRTLKNYADSISAGQYMPPMALYTYLLALTDEDRDEIMKMVEEQNAEEDRDFEPVEEVTPEEEPIFNTKRK